MNSLARLAVGLFAVCSASSAVAATPANKHYVSFSYFANETEISVGSGAYRLSLDNIGVRYGYKLFKFLSVEGILSTSDERVFEDDGTRVKNNYLVGAFARGEFEFTAANTTVYGLLGASRAKTTHTTDATLLTSASSEEETANGLSFGLGVELFGSPSTSFHAEFVRYLNTDYLTSEGVVLGITHHFSLPSSGTR